MISHLFLKVKTNNYKLKISPKIKTCFQIEGNYFKIRGVFIL